MSKRTDAIRSMFSMPQSEMLSADNNSSILPRVSAGTVRALKDTFSEVERENEQLRAQLGSGIAVIELDPSLIDSSPLADRFAEQDLAPFELLKSSILQKGQEIPILAREHPDVAGRYQLAYGHRRVRAAKELGIQVKTLIRKMTDEDLVVAQGIENSVREDLSFIERAVFATRLEDAGFQRSVVQAALSIDRAEASKLVAVARSIPEDIVHAIGRAAKVGRGRWQVLADAVKTPSHLKCARSAIRLHNFSEQPTDVRFLMVLTAASKSEADRLDPSQKSISSRKGAEIARFAFTPGEAGPPACRRTGPAAAPARSRRRPQR